MPPFFEHALRITWLVLVAYWFWAARSATLVERQEPFSKRVFAYWMPLLLAVLLLGPGPWFGQSLLRYPSILGGYLARTGVPQCN